MRKKGRQTLENANRGLIKNEMREDPSINSLEKGRQVREVNDGFGLDEVGLGGVKIIDKDEHIRMGNNELQQERRGVLSVKMGREHRWICL